MNLRPPVTSSLNKDFALIDQTLHYKEASYTVAKFIALLWCGCF
jgi:hypothetical protein